MHACMHLCTPLYVSITHKCTGNPSEAATLNEILTAAKEVMELFKVKFHEFKDRSADARHTRL
jgi:hypothetical protein